MSDCLNVSRTGCSAALLSSHPVGRVPGRLAPRRTDCLSALCLSSSLNYHNFPTHPHCYGPGTTYFPVRYRNQVGLVILVLISGSWALWLSGCQVANTLGGEEIHEVWGANLEKAQPRAQLPARLSERQAARCCQAVRPPGSQAAS